MPSFHDSYKPFRNYVRRFDLTSTLVDLWVYFRHLDDDAPLPPDYAVGASGLWHSSLKGQVFPWDLDTLTREVLLNAGSGGDRSLKRWGDLAEALKHIRRLEDEAFKLGTNPQDAVMIELHRVAHRQLPGQQPIGMNPMMRVFKIFGTPAIETIVLRELDMTTRQYMRLGAALSGGVIRSPAVLTSNDYSVLKVPKEAVSAFLSRITISKGALRTKLEGLQSYGRDWLYTWNPLEGTPLVGVDVAVPDRALCPIPRHLLRRVSFGIYYDLVRASGFDNAFGDAFQAYVGDILKATCNPARFQIRAERQYHVGGDKKHGVDWALSDETAHLFIECKTKRLTLGSRTHCDVSALEKDVCVLAESVVQNYRNIQDVLDGKTDWVVDQRPVFSIILLMEDWFIISPKVSEMLNASINRLLLAIGLPTDLPQRIPYVIASANDFEIACQVVAQTGIARVMSARPATQSGAWSLLGVVQTNFKSEMSRINWRLFESEWHRTMAAWQ
jgi:hypothetical protein